MERMKKIIDGKLYDTDRAKKIASYTRKHHGRYHIMVAKDVDIYLTEKGNYFSVVDDTSLHRLDEEDVRQRLEEHRRPHRAFRH